MFCDLDFFESHVSPMKTYCKILCNLQNFADICAKLKRLKILPSQGSVARIALQYIFWHCMKKFATVACV